MYELERFLNNLIGDVISIIPKIKKLSLPQIYGITSRVDYLLIVEKLANKQKKGNNYSIHEYVTCAIARVA